MTVHTNRRHILLSGAALATLMLPGCQSMPAFSLTEAIRRLLTVASQNAFALLLQPGGFYDSSVARISLPDRLGGERGTGILSVVLQSRQFRDRLQRQLNRAAEKGAERAAPLVADAVRNLSIEDAASLVRGGPQAATAFGCDTHVTFTTPARLAELIHPDDRPAFAQSFTESARLLVPWHWDGRMVTGEGVVKWVQGSATPYSGTT